MTRNMKKTLCRLYQKTLQARYLNFICYNSKLMVERGGPGKLTPLQRAVEMRAKRAEEGGFEKEFENMNARAKKKPTDGPNAALLEKSEILRQGLRGAATGKKSLKSRF